MKHVIGPVRAGLRDKESNKLMAVYPHCVEGNEREIEDKVKFWFYQQSCGAEDALQNLYVDVITESEAKNHGIDIDTKCR